MFDTKELRKKSVRWKNLSKLEKREARWGYGFIGLWLIGFFLFYFLPMVVSLFFSLMDFTVVLRK